MRLVDFVYHSTLGLKVIKKKRSTRPGGNPVANIKSISHRCYLREVAFEWELTKETIYLPLGCLQGGPVPGNIPGNRMPKPGHPGCLVRKTYTRDPKLEAECPKPEIQDPETHRSGGLVRKSHTRKSKSETRDPEPEPQLVPDDSSCLVRKSFIRNPKSETPKPNRISSPAACLVRNPETRNPKPETRDPEPETPNP